MIGFGEIALLLNDKRTATVTATGESGCDCWVLSADIFKHIIAQNTLRRRGLNLQYLNQVKLFKKLEVNDKMKLIDGLTQATFTKDQFVFHEGEIGDKFFIIETGACECLKTTENGELESIRTLKEGNHFGEVAIINDSKRTLSVRAATDCRLLVLSR
jgi:cAMP-dependent protein kinase regulator